METTTSNKLEITIVSLCKMDKLAVGDIFLFSADGPKYVFLGRTLDGRFSYMRTDTKRKYYSLRNRQVFNMDADGGLFIANGELLVMETNKSNKQDIELQELAKEGFEIRPLRKVPQGTYFRLKLNGKIYIRGYYERSSKKYCCISYDNANKWRFFKGDKLVAL